MQTARPSDQAERLVLRPPSRATLLDAVGCRGDGLVDGASRQCQLSPGLSSELLTWLVGNLSAFCFKTAGGCDQILHFKLGAREQRVCFVECLTK